MKHCKQLIRGVLMVGCVLGAMLAVAGGVNWLGQHHIWILIAIFILIICYVVGGLTK